MKRYFLLIAVMAVAAIASCTKQPIDDIQPYEPSSTSPYIYTVKASASQTKSDYSAGGAFTWSAGDAISVLFHNGTTNKFFTLTTTGTGSSATFSGTIEAGYEIGASDGTGADKKIWALFPASDNHSYTEGSNPTFYVQPEVDFSATHFSANIPMYALNAAEGSFTFANLACTYKFTVKNIKAGVDKVQFQIHNQETSESTYYGLSGAWLIHADKYINYGYAGIGDPNNALTYVSDVTAGEAVFYVSCRYWGKFKPEITITNCATGVPIKTFTATKEIQPTSFTNVQRIELDVDDGDYFSPAVLIDGDFSDWSAVAELPSTRSDDTANSRISLWKTTADARYISVYLKLVTEKIKKTAPDIGDSYVYVGFDTAEGGSSHGGLAGLEQYVVVYPCVDDSSPLEFIQGADPRSTVNGSSDGTLLTWGEFGTGGDSAYSFVELRIPRSSVSLTSAGSVKVAVAFDWYDTKFQTLVLP